MCEYLSFSSHVQSFNSNISPVEQVNGVNSWCGQSHRLPSAVEEADGRGSDNKEVLNLVVLPVSFLATGFDNGGSAPLASLIKDPNTPDTSCSCWIMKGGGTTTANGPNGTTSKPQISSLS